jgi:hypothetical protein
MAFDFPAAPAADEIYTSGGVTYRWDGSVWRAGDAALMPNAYVKIVGDTMTGPLLLPAIAPTQPPEATHKRYVDESIATMSLYQGTYQVTANIPDLDPLVAQPLHGYSWTAKTADPNQPEMALANIPGIGGLMIASNDTIKWNANTFLYEHIPTPLNAATMLVQDTPPTTAFQGQCWFDSDSGKQYVFFIDAGGGAGQWVQMSGGGGGTNVVPISDAPPANPAKGELWFCSADASMYIWYDDGTTTPAWVEVSA